MRGAVSTLEAPYFVKRTARLASGDTASDVIPQAPVVATDARGITAPLALVETEVGAVRGRIALVVAPFARDDGRSLMATEAFRGLEGLEQAGAVRPNAGELSTFTDRGYGTAFAVIGQHAWFHTVEDTFEPGSASLLAPVVRAHQRAIELSVGPR